MIVRTGFVYYNHCGYAVGCGFKCRSQRRVLRLDYLSAFCCSYNFQIVKVVAGCVTMGASLSQRQEFLLGQLWSDLACEAFV